MALLTYRKNQVTFKPGMSCPNQLIGGILFCGSKEGRDNWVRFLSQKHWQHFNSFVFFKDVQSDYALQFGHQSFYHAVHIQR